MYRLIKNDCMCARNPNILLPKCRSGYWPFVFFFFGTFYTSLINKDICKDIDKSELQKTIYHYRLKERFVKSCHVTCWLRSFVERYNFLKLRGKKILKKVDDNELINTKKPQKR